MTHFCLTRFKPSQFAELLKHNQRDASATSSSIPLGLPIASRVEPAGMSDRRAGARLLAGLAPLFPRIQTVIADAGHESQKLSRELLRDNGWNLQIVKRRQRAFKITGLTWIVNVRLRGSDATGD